MHRKEKKVVQFINASGGCLADTDPAFHERVRKLMAAELATLAKRFGKMTVGAWVTAYHGRAETHYLRGFQRMRTKVVPVPRHAVW